MSEGDGRPSREGGPFTEAATAVGEVIAGYRRFAADAGELAALEARLAGLAAVRMVGAGVAGAILATAAWLLAQAAVFVWVTALGAPAPWVLVALAGVNVAGVWGVGWYLRRLSRWLTFENTRELLLGGGEDARTRTGSASSAPATEQRP